MSGPPSQMTLEQVASHAFSSDRGYYLGLVFLGFAFDLFLFGIALHQLITYLGATTKERPFVMTIVILSALIMFATTGFLVYRTWTYFINGFGLYAQFLLVGFKPITLLTQTTIAVVQLFYLDRAYKLLNRAKWVLFCVGPLIVASWGAGVGLIIGTFKLKIITEFKTLLPWIYSYDICVVVADLIMTGCIIYALRRSKTGWSHTDSVISKLIAMTFESQLPCTVFAVVILLTSVIKSDSLLNTFWTFWYGKVYTVSLYAVLNARLSMRQDDSTTKNSTFRNQTFARASRVQQDTIRLDDIHVETQCYTESHSTPDLQLGINRRKMMDDDDGLSGKDEYSSTTALTPVTKVEYQNPV